MTYLELCQRFVADNGIAGATGPAAVTGQVGELRNVVNWIADAAIHVENIWLDWKFHWTQYSESLVVDSYYAPEPSSGAIRVRQWDVNRLKIRETGGEWVELEYVPRKEFFDSNEPDDSTAAMPTLFTVMPDNRIVFDVKSDDTYEVKGEFWRRPERMTANDDEPGIPEEYDRIILARALIQYGTREDAPELITGGEAEFLDVLDKLQSDQLEDQERNRSSTDRMRQAQYGGFPL